MASIHLIDDDPQHHAQTSRLLRDAGHTLVDGIAPDLILCHAAHPQALLLAQQRAVRWAGVPLLLLAPLNATAQRDNLLKAGFDGYLSLPLEAESVGDELAAFLPPPPHQQCPTLLLVDDDPFMLLLLRETVAAEAWRVLSAASGAAALALLEHEQVEVVVSDHWMPSQTGAELLTAVRKRAPASVRLLLSGDALADGIASALASGDADGFMSKPWEMDALLVRLREAFTMQRERAAALVADSV